MATLKHKMGRVAFSKTFDIAYSKVGKDRQKGRMDIFHMVQGYIQKLNMGIDLKNFEAQLFTV